MTGKLFRLFTALALLSLPASPQAATFNAATLTDFQNALTTAQSNGEADTINVSAGTYAIGSTLTYASEQNFDLTIVGAGAVSTILDGGGLRQCMNLSNNSGGGVFVSGLTCRNGRATSLGGGLAINCVDGAATLSNCRLLNNVSERSAGGAYIGGLNGAVTVFGCIVDGNSLDPITGDDGGGLDIYIGTGGTADITLENSTITNNVIGECPSAVGSPDGAGVFMYHLGSGGTIMVRNNTIADNTALGGPAGFYFRATLDATFIFDGNTVSGNASGRAEAGVSGGGLHADLDAGTITFSNNKILNNRAIGPWANGGGVDLVLQTSGTCDIVNNVFAENTAHQHGGGMSLFVGDAISRALVTGNLFVGNQAGSEDGSGGGLMLNGECSVTLANNTFYNNRANDAGGLGYYAEGTGPILAVANDVYRSNTPVSISNMGTGSLTATYSNIEGASGETWFGTGCIDTDPLFFQASDPPGEDGIYATLDDGLHLTATSPSMNKGSNAAVPAVLTTDIAGRNRIQDITVDMGAYEGPAGSSLPSCSDCVASPVILEGITFDSNTACECSDSVSITIRSGVTVESGARIIFKAPVITLENICEVKQGATVEMRQP
ncbi:MAG: hypothetical protein KQJ78_25640 [Deltaproteobacteria bacterium]|nr:hypothetical protein [Deltaproteobacteria bacterium]